MVENTVNWSLSSSTAFPVEGRPSEQRRTVPAASFLLAAFTGALLLLAPPLLEVLLTLLLAVVSVGLESAFAGMVARVFRPIESELERQLEGAYPYSIQSLKTTAIEVSILERMRHRERLEEFAYRGRCEWAY